MEKKKPKMTKMYNKNKRIESDSNEIINYLNVLNKRKKIFVSIPKVEDELELYKKSWDNIWKKSNEPIGFFIRHILFILQMKADKSEIEDFKNIKNSDKENKQIFFESIFNVSKPLEIPFEMTDNDFEKYNQFFIQK